MLDTYLLKIQDQLPDAPPYCGFVLSRYHVINRRQFPIGIIDDGHPCEGMLLQYR